MGIRHMAWGVALAAALSVTLVAQQAPVGYHNISCVRVKPGQSAAFHALLNGDYHKVEQASVDSGGSQPLLRCAPCIPAGTDAGCDYVLVTFYPGFPPAPLGDDEMTAVLQKAGVASTVQQWHDRLSAVGELVSNNITQYQVLVGGSKKGDYLVFNSMKATDVDECVAVQKRLWQPFAEQGVKDGAQDGWAVNIQQFPQRRQRPEPCEHRRHLPELGFDVHLLRTRLHHSLEEGSSRDDHRRCVCGIDKACTIEHTVLYKVEDQINATK